MKLFSVMKLVKIMKIYRSQYLRIILDRKLIWKEAMLDSVRNTYAYSNKNHLLLLIVKLI